RRISSSPLYDVKSWGTNSTCNFPLIIRRRLATLKRIRGASCVWEVTWGRPLPLRAHRGPFCFSTINAFSLQSYFRIGGQVSVPLGRTKHESMGSAITSQSLDEASSRKAVGRFVQEGLVMWLATAKGMETDGLSGEVHVAADESMRPQGVDPEGTTEQADGADLRTAADEDDRSRRMGLQVGPPGGREWPSCRRRLD